MSISGPATSLHQAIDRFANWNQRRLHSKGLNHPLDRLLRAAARLYAYYELPRCVAVLDALQVGRAGLFAGERQCRGCWHGYFLRLDMTDYYQRWAYFLSRYHEVPLQILLWRALRPGDTFVDGGAHLGLVSMFASWRIGPRGRVLSFEPNPQAFSRLAWHIQHNSLTNIDARREGLSDCRAELLLQVPGKDNIGAGTFCPPPSRYAGVTSASARARTIRADTLDLPAGPLTIKLDVEGFELRALRGMESLLSIRRPLVITELNPEMLHAAGDSPESLFAYMQSRGYHAHGFTTARAILRHRKLCLWRIPDGAAPLPADIAWIHPESVGHSRLSRFISASPPGATP